MEDTYSGIQSAPPAPRNYRSMTGSGRGSLGLNPYPRSARRASRRAAMEGWSTCLGHRQTVLYGVGGGFTAGSGGVYRG